MKPKSALKAFCCCIPIIAAAACYHPISKNLRERAEMEHLTFSEVLDNPDAYKNKTVLWGGKIIKAVNTCSGTDIYVLETPLHYWEVPGAAESMQGRFIARSSTVLDPAIYGPYRDITIAGEVIGSEIRRQGTADYRYPVVRVDELYVWERYQYQYPDYSWQAPYWGPTFYPEPSPLYPRP